ncbi:hypothetical protein [Haliea sp.]
MNDARRPTSDAPRKSESSPAPAPAATTAPEVQACNELGTLLGSELAQVEEEINRVGSMIAEAVLQLSASFDHLHRLASAHDASSSGDPELEGAVSGAVRSLQFEDMASQALAEAHRSLSYLRGVAEELQTVHDTGELATRISEQHRLWADTRRKAVSQQNLDKGSVELF